MLRPVLRLGPCVVLAVLLSVQQGAAAALTVERWHLAPLPPGLAERAPLASAAEAFSAWADALGGAGGAGAEGGTAVSLLHLDAARQAEIAAEVLERFEAEARGFKRREAYVLVYEPQRRVLYVVAEGEMGFAYGLSDLQTRLRHAGERAVLAFPEWPADGPGPHVLLERPAIEHRGEYLNIGYNIPPITPHEWEPQRWAEYVDKLVLARVNTLYLYLWVNKYTTYPGSRLAGEPVNQKVHAGMQAAVRHAHRRGLKVIHMICPTFIPKDLWDANPQMRAEIEYAEHGFPAVCPNAPGAWELMTDVWRHEMEALRGADGVQIWFYDPGGCWCEKHGCKQNQAASLARQVKEFGELFRRINPGGRVEFNLWPQWLWQARMKVTYRDAMGRAIRDRFPGGAHAEIIANGAPDTPESQPQHERSLGFKTGVFIFAANPETGYVFLIPNLRYLRQVTREMHAQQFDAVFGHRLEAWTRYPSTYFMGQFLWDPDAQPDAVVRRFAHWQTADAGAGEKLAAALLLLDRFTDEGASADSGAEMARLTGEALAAIPAGATREQLAYLGPMMDALAAIGATAGTEDPAVLDAQRQTFQAALAKDPVFASIRSKPDVFERYRKHLLQGWAKQPF